ncbi:MAG TPA: RnfABCDGE type electron transport complex subunit E [Candidatus Methanoperedens sp.]|nr:RnfABCDGE type electron transport complex subunit E [Candidatus Methanoperedens sp.]
MAKEKSALQVFLNGIVEENPILVLMIGLCPTLAVSSNANDALGMGVAASFVLIASNLLISLLRKLTPGSIRIPIFIVIIAGFVTLIDLLMHAYQPALYKNLGVFVPLIVVNCIILGRAEAFAYTNGLVRSGLDGLGMGLGFTLVIVILGAFREILGNGTLTLFNTELFNFGAGFPPALVFIMPPGGFLAIGFLMALKQKFWKKG